ncbi:MAG: bifunctional adenosylcobinamide kinase/adenosylcobinamide-phosphate guanylyltransferase [Eubacteriaceae bacterium]|nr:bifunctional adenosylcobinamide kinase/adenosylcobinamide-phosphate guanylyltransferase [Eubacteriaceae bacterium]
MLIFISGGVKGGKSMFAQYLARSLASDGASLGYAATMIPFDDEDRKRVARHLADRSGWGFSTYEEPFDVGRICRSIGAREVILLDSLTALVQNNIFPDAGTVRLDITAEDICRGIFELSEKAKDLIVVSDYIFSDACVYDELTEFFRRILGECHCLIASEAGIVLECFFSNIKEWKNLSGTDLTKVKEHYYLNYDHLRYFDI